MDNSVVMKKWAFGFEIRAAFELAARLAESIQNADSGNDEGRRLRDYAGGAGRDAHRGVREARQDRDPRQADDRRSGADEASTPQRPPECRHASSIPGA